MKIFILIFVNRFALKSYLYKHEESSCLKNHLKSEKMKNLPTTKSNSSSRKKAIKVLDGPDASAAVRAIVVVANN